MKLKLYENFDQEETPDYDPAIDKFWDAHWQVLIKYVDDNLDNEMMRDIFASFGMDDNTVDAEMDGTSKHQAISLVHLHFNKNGKEGLDDLLAELKETD